MISFYDFLTGKIRSTYEICNISRNNIIDKKANDRCESLISHYNTKCSIEDFEHIVEIYAQEVDKKKIIQEALATGSFGPELLKHIKKDNGFFKIYSEEVQERKKINRQTQEKCSEMHSSVAEGIRNAIIGIIFEYIVNYFQNVFLYGTFSFNKFSSKNKWFQFSSPLTTADIDISIDDNYDYAITSIFDDICKFANNYAFVVGKFTKTKIVINEIRFTSKNDGSSSISIEFRCYDCDYDSCQHFLCKSNILDCTSIKQIKYPTKFPIQYKNITYQHPLTYLVGMVYTIFNIWEFPIQSLTTQQKTITMNKWIERFKKMTVYCDQFTTDDKKMIEEIKSVNKEYNTEYVDTFFANMIGGTNIEELLQYYKQYLIEKKHLEESQIII